MQTLTEPAATLGDPEDGRYTAVPASAPTDPAEKTGLASRLDAEGVIGRARADTYNTAVRLRSQIAPHAAAGAVLGVGLGMDAIVASGGLSAGAMALTAAAVSGSAVGALILRARRRGSEWVHRIALAGLGATAWLTAAPFGVGTGDIAVLVAGEYVTAARWWQTNRIGYPTDETELDLNAPEVEPEPLAPVEQIIADWDEYIGCAHGPLRNSRLIAPKQHQHGYEFTLQLWRGQHTFTTAIGALDKIASGLAVAGDQVLLDEVPVPVSPSGEKRPPRCRVQVITQSPIAGDVVFNGPRRRGGLLELGPHADGSGEAVYRLYTPGSMWSGVIIGGTGIGKSRVAENIVISAISGGDTAFWFLDGQNGSSSPALRDHADWYGGLTDAPSMADAAVAILKARSDENSVMGWTGFTPSPQRPGLLIVIDESHAPFRDPAEAEKWGDVAREGRKVGMSLLVIDQFPHLKTFGGSEELRSSVMEGNALVFRSTSNSTGQLMAGLTVDPKTLPKIPGFGYVQGSDETGIRTAPFRNRDTNSPDGPGPARWLAAQRTPELDVLSATATLAAGTAYQDRHTTTTAGRAGSRARVEALRNGHLPAGMLNGTPDTTHVKVAEVVQFPTFRLIETDTAQPAHRPAADGLTDSQRLVVDAVAAGHTRPAEIEQATGLKHRQVAYLLKELVASGHLTQPKYGRYERAA